MTCRAATARRARRAAAQLEADARVAHVSLVEPAADPTDAWLLDIVVSDGHDGLPADLCCSLPGTPVVRHVASQGEHWTAHLVVG